MTVHSKFAESLMATCQEVVHPWTNSCLNASAGLILGSIEPTLRMYIVLYLFTLLMRRRIPTLKDLKNTVENILISTSAIITNGFVSLLSVCILRNLIGRYYFLTIAFLPTVIGSTLAILMDRPERRTPLALYVANVGSETLWNMLEARGWVHTIPNGQVLLFAIAMTALMYLYRLGLHKTTSKDSIFNIINFVLGKYEEGPVQSENKNNKPKPHLKSSERITSISLLIKNRHRSCPHNDSCFKYTIRGGLKPFLGGVGIQLGLNILINIKKIINFQANWRDQFFNRKALQFGLFLGSFSFLYKSISCSLRHIFGYDDPLYAIPAAFVSSISFSSFPKTTMALYGFWKSVQLYYNWGVENKKLPKINHAVIYVYSFFTAVLFHSAILEPISLRPSYFKFLYDLSSERLTSFNLKQVDVFGLNTVQQNFDALKRLKINVNQRVPKFAFAD